MFDRLARKLVNKAARDTASGRQLAKLLLNEAFFLLVAPWLLILPAHVLTTWVPLAVPRAVEGITGGLVAIAGLLFSLWAVACQWKEGRGTPSPSAPTRKLVVGGPYRFTRNPIQFGALLYVLGLGTLFFSLPCGVLAFTAGQLVGIVYIKGVEEKELAIRFGEEYEAYRMRTPFLFPRLIAARQGEQAPQSLPTQGRVLVRAAAVYDAVQPLVTLGQESKLNRWVAEGLALEDGMDVLDVGCGTGLLTVEIATRYPGCKVEGIDASMPMIRVARRKRGRDNCSFQQALAEDLPYPDRRFDVVTSALFFHHVNRDLKRRCLAEIRRVLKPGGRLIIADMSKPYTVAGRMLSYGAWLLFRQPEIKENIDGVLEKEVRAAGFENMEGLGRFSGYISVFSATKPT